MNFYLYVLRIVLLSGMLMPGPAGPMGGEGQPPPPPPAPIESVPQGIGMGGSTRAPTPKPQLRTKFPETWIWVDETAR